MIDCSKKKNLSIEEYVWFQFNCRKLDGTYKNVLLHTSLLEGLIVKKSEDKDPHKIKEKCSECGREYNFRTFRDALVVLKDDIGTHKSLFDKIYDKRIPIVHKFAALDQHALEFEIKEVWKMILEVYRDSEFLNMCFSERYGFKPKEIIIGRQQSELGQDT